MTDRFRHTLPFGAELQPDGETRFRLWAPSTDVIQLCLPHGETRMVRDPSGWHTVTQHAPAGTHYSFRLPDGLEVPDPASRMQQDDVHGPSLVVDPTSFRWRNHDWSGRPWHEAVIYECHPGLMGGFTGITEQLPNLARLGITVIELMPIADVPGPRNWGYDGVLPFAPDRELGTPEELKTLIDTAHGLGLMVMLDVVYNHFGPDGAYLHIYAKPFFREDIHTPWGAAIAFERPEVRQFFTHNALYWLQEYRFDGLRFDAAHAIHEESFFTDMAITLREANPARHIHLVLENENNAAHLLVPGMFDAQWADDLHHCLHVLLTGEHEGYYSDFQDTTRQLARCLAEGFAYQGEVAPHLHRPRGEPSGHLPNTAFVMCLQNHDQIGNRALGERLTTLAPPDKLAAAQAMLLLSPFIPLLFMGEEWASTTPFQFFTSHNDELAALIDDGRRKEFQHFSAFKDTEKQALIPAPNDAATFHSSRPQRTDPAAFDRIAALLHLRRTYVTPGIPGCRTAGVDILAPGAVRAAWTLGTGQTLTILVNLSDVSVETLPAERQMIFATPGATPAHLPSGSIAVLLG